MARPHGRVVRSERFLARRRHVRREHRRRRRRVFLSAVALAATGLIGWGLVRSSLFALEGIEVTGNRLLSRAAVLQVSGITPGMNVLSVHPDLVEARIGRLPMVRSVIVERIYPSRVRIVIVERAPAAVMETTEGRWFLDAEGSVLGSTDAVPRGLPVIVVAGDVPAGAGDRVRHAGVPDALRLWEALPESLRKGSPAIEATRPNRLTLVLGPLRILFGSTERLADKLDAVQLVLARARVERARVVSIDVRAPARPAARIA